MINQDVHRSWGCAIDPDSRWYSSCVFCVVFHCFHMLHLSYLVVEPIHFPQKTIGGWTNKNAWNHLLTKSWFDCLFVFLGMFIHLKVLFFSFYLAEIISPLIVGSVVWKMKKTILDSSWMYIPPAGKLIYHISRGLTELTAIQTGNYSLIHFSTEESCVFFFLGSQCHRVHDAATSNLKIYVPESSKGLKFGPLNHQKQTQGLEFDTLGGSR